MCAGAAGIGSVGDGIGEGAHAPAYTNMQVSVGFICLQVGVAILAVIK